MSGLGTRRPTLRTDTQRPWLPGSPHPGPTTPTPRNCWPRWPSRWGEAALVLGAGELRHARPRALAGEGAIGVGLEANPEAGGRAGPRSRWNGNGDGGRGQARCDQRRSSANRLLRSDRELFRDGWRTRTPSSTSRLIPIAFGRRRRVVDLVYAGSESRLLADTRGATTIDGLEILVRRGGRFASGRVWTHHSTPCAKRLGEEVRRMAETLRLTPHETVTIRESSPELLEWREAGGQGVRRRRSPPPPPQDERFEVLEGTLTPRVEGEERELDKGETLDIARAESPSDLERGSRGQRVRSGRRARPSRGPSSS